MSTPPFDPKYARHRLICWSRRRAAERGILWNLTDLHVPDACPVLGVPFERRGIWAPTLDRIFSDMGYIDSNVIVVSKRANLIRSDGTPAEILRVGEFYLELFRNYPR